MDEQAQITMLLRQARDGRPGALDELLPLVYAELRRIARRHRRREPASPTLNTTAVVHEAFLKVFNPASASLEDRAHFYAVACLAMRQVLRDGARRHLAGRRGGGAPHTRLTDHEPAVDQKIELLLALDEALDQLRAIDARGAEVVALRYFGGLTAEEAAELLGVTVRTVERDWQRARVILAGLLDDGPDRSEGPRP